ncbi:DUF4012 domain-containing protein [Nonomuraea sp. NPDC049480]|uniref:DUF4012 domain-containing protein n=1 Tax=Nonomuraea sp. NPDC049480 TaxID=3364353 RepID=UPI0037AC383E
MPSKKRRRIATGLLCSSAGLALAAGWSAHLVLSVRDHLQATRDALIQLRASDPVEAAGALADTKRRAEEARRLTSGPDWSLIAHTPVVGAGATTVRGLAEAADELAGVLVDLQRTGAGLITTEGLSMDSLGTLLARLESAAPLVRDAADRIELTRSRLAATPAHTGVDQIDEARATALREVDRLSGWLDVAEDAAPLLPRMLGHHGPRRYFLAFQTNAEARGTGGLVGAFGILKAGHGGIGIKRLSPNNDLESGSARVTDHGPAFLARYGPSAVSLLSNSNLSPHFPYAATTWTELWRRQTGQRLDGAIATDPIGLAYILKLIGPVNLPSGETVTAENVVDLTERAAYERYPDPLERKRFLITVASAVSETMTRAHLDSAALLSTLSQLMAERRLQIWSRRDAEQQRLAATPFGGVLPEKPGPFAGLVINNSAGTKLDYYLDRSLEYELGPCRSDGQRVSRVRIRLGNDVPGVQLPSYVTDRLDSPEHRPAVGSNLLWVSFYASVDAKLLGMRVDGKPHAVIKEVERAHPVYSAVLELAPRQARTLEFVVLEPASATPPIVPVQPLARPQQTKISQDPGSCAPADRDIER